MWWVLSQKRVEKQVGVLGAMGNQPFLLCLASFLVLDSASSSPLRARQKSHSLDPEPKARTSCLLPEAQGAGPTECTVGRPSTFPTFWEDVALALISNIWAPSAKVSNHLFLRQRETSSGSVSACDGPRQHSGKGGSCARLPYAQLSSKRNVSEQAFRRPGRQG